MASDMQYDKSSGTSATPYFDSKRHGYAANPGRTNAGTPSPAGGEVRPITLSERAGKLSK
jgi:hypothetical protein